MHIDFIFDKLPASTKRSLSALEKYLDAMPERPKSVAVFDEDFRAIKETANKLRADGQPEVTDFSFRHVQLRRHEKRYKGSAGR